MLILKEIMVKEIEEKIEELEKRILALEDCL